MNKIKSWYNQNRRIIWVVVLTFVGVIGLLQILNNYYKNKADDESSSTNLSTTAYNTNNYSVITQDSIDESTAKESNNIIDTFLSCCNNREYERAYSFLSSECKEELYPTINEFKEQYIDRIFTETKNYDSTLWINASDRNTYRISIMKDMLATGERDYIPIEDFYTIVYENGEYKLNISGYIGKENLNAEKTENDITIKIISRKMYIDYEIYEILVKNNTGIRLVFNTKHDTNSTYIQDENDLKYIAFINEIADNQFEISNGFEKTYNIKFNRGYKPDIKIKQIVFGNIGINSSPTIKIDL